MGFFNGHWIGGEERHNSPAAHLVAVSDSFVRAVPMVAVRVNLESPRPPSNGSTAIGRW